MYKESIYGGEKIIAQLDARIQPYDARIPDCICALVLTEKFLAVLEDNYDGTFEEHLQIPVSDMLYFDHYKKEGQEETLGEYFKYKSIFNFKRQKNNDENNEKHLKLSYKTSSGKREDLYFMDMKSNPAEILSRTASLMQVRAY